MEKRDRGASSTMKAEASPPGIVKGSRKADRDKCFEDQEGKESGSHGRGKLRVADTQGMAENSNICLIDLAEFQSLSNKKCKNIAHTTRMFGGGTTYTRMIGRCIAKMDEWNRGCWIHGYVGVGTDDGRLVCLVGGN